MWAIGSASVEISTGVLEKEKRSEHDDVKKLGGRLPHEANDREAADEIRPS
jgi:hypothetical protein